MRGSYEWIYLGCDISTWCSLYLFNYLDAEVVWSEALEYAEKRSITSQSSCLVCRYFVNQNNKLCESAMVICKMYVEFGPCCGQPDKNWLDLKCLTSENMYVICKLVQVY